MTPRVRIDIHKPGEGDESHEYEHCPIQFSAQFSTTCPLRTDLTCNFGLTEIAPPKDCPLRGCGPLMMKFTVVGED